MIGINIDLFAGGGGASVGIEAATGRPVDIALNHDAVALAVHKQNHPRTAHLEADIWSVNPITVTRGRPVNILWASPDCTHFSNAKGAVPRSQNIRSLAWSVVKWADQTRPRIIFLENVTEFQKWGPLGPDGRPCKARMGTTFNRWVKRLQKLGYAVDYRVIDASEYGAPTRRRRLFVIARRDGMPIRWPEPTHGPGLLPFHTAAECIDWSLPCPSIFERKRPLADKTLWRIAQGIRRFVLECTSPFIVHVNHGRVEFRGQGIDEPLSTVTAQRRGHALVTPHLSKFQQNSVGQSPAEPVHTVMAGAQRFGLVAPTLVQTGYGERPGQAPRVPGLHKPLGTCVDGQKHALVSAYLAKHYGDPCRKDGAGGVVLGTQLDLPLGTVTARDHHSLAAVTLAKFRGTSDQHPGCCSVDEPLHTVTASGNHVAEVRAFLTAYYSRDAGQALNEPARTFTAKHRLGLVTVEGTDYQITDIGLRMLQPHELLRAQFGRFANDYKLDAAETKEAQVRLIGNSVCPEVAEAIVRANVGDVAQRGAA